MLDQHIFARKLNTKKRRKLADITPIEEKESYRWLQSLRNAREIAGDTQVVIPARRKTPHGKERAARTALLTIKFGSFLLNPPRNNVKHRTSELPDLPMHAVYVFEVHPPDGAEPVEWMLLTNLRVTHFDEAYEKVLWYCLRWRIEMFFKVLKSGFLGEVVIWIARLGGFLARKGDGMPGTMTLWRGWKRLTDLTEGWNLAIHGGTCG